MSSVGCFGHLVSVLELAASLSCGGMIAAAGTAADGRRQCPVLDVLPDRFGGQRAGNRMPKTGHRGSGSWQPSPLALLRGCLTFALRFWARLFALCLGVFHL